MKNIILCVALCAVAFVTTVWAMPVADCRIASQENNLTSSGRLAITNVGTGCPCIGKARWEFLDAGGMMSGDWQVTYYDDLNGVFVLQEGSGAVDFVGEYNCACEGETCRVYFEEAFYPPFNPGTVIWVKLGWYEFKCGGSCPEE